jgi:hypothetical protein
MPPDFESSVLVAIVTASVFSTTLLSTRRHEERSRALERFSQLGRHFDPQSDADSISNTLKEQEQLLLNSVDDPFAVAIVSMNVMFALVLVWLAFGFGFRWPPADSASRSLTAFLMVEVVVVLIGIADAVLVYVDIRRRLLLHPGGLAGLADRDIVSATKRRSLGRIGFIRKRLVHRSIIRAARACQLTGDRHAFALAVLGVAEMVAIYRGVSGFVELQPAEHVKRAIELGERKAYTLATLAHAQWRVRDYDEAARSLVDSYSVDIDAIAQQVKYHQARRQKIRSVEDVTSGVLTNPPLDIKAFKQAFDDRHYSIAGLLLVRIVNELRSDVSQEGWLAKNTDELLSAIERDDSRGALARWAELAPLANALLSVSPPRSAIAKTIEQHIKGPIMSLHRNALENQIAILEQIESAHVATQQAISQSRKMREDTEQVLSDWHQFLDQINKLADGSDNTKKDN